MNKGEIWLIEIPSTNGYEQEGTRPAIVLADTPANVAIVVPLTSNVQALRFPSTIAIKPTKRNGLRAISVGLVFQVRAIDKKRLNKKVGDLEDETLKELDGILIKLSRTTCFSRWRVYYTPLFEWFLSMLRNQLFFPRAEARSV